MDLFNNRSIIIDGDWRGKKGGTGFTRSGISVKKPGKSKKGYTEIPSGLRFWLPSALISPGNGLTPVNSTR